MTTATDPVVAALRAEITALDARLIETVNARIKLVEKLRSYKRQNGIAFLDPNRESALLQQLKELNSGPLSEDGLQEFLTFVLALVKQELADE